MDEKDRLASLEADILTALELAEQCGLHICAAHLGAALDDLRILIVDIPEPPKTDPT